jgi:hypothetical protein
MSASLPLRSPSHPNPTQPNPHKHLPTALQAERAARAEAEQGLLTMHQELSRMSDAEAQARAAAELQIMEMQREFEAAKVCGGGGLGMCMVFE